MKVLFIPGASDLQPVDASGHATRLPDPKDGGPTFRDLTEALARAASRPEETDWDPVTRTLVASDLGSAGSSLAASGFRMPILDAICGKLAAPCEWHLIVTNQTLPHAKDTVHLVPIIRAYLSQYRPKDRIARVREVRENPSDVRVCMRELEQWRDSVGLSPRDIVIVGPGTPQFSFAQSCLLATATFWYPARVGESGTEIVENPVRPQELARLERAIAVQDWAEAEVAAGALRMPDGVTGLLRGLRHRCALNARDALRLLASIKDGGALRDVRHDLEELRKLPDSRELIVGSPGFASMLYELLDRSAAERDSDVSIHVAILRCVVEQLGCAWHKLISDQRGLSHVDAERNGFSSWADLLELHRVAPIMDEAHFARPWIGRDGVAVSTFFTSRPGAFGALRNQSYLAHFGRGQGLSDLLRAEEDLARHLRRSGKLRGAQVEVTELVRSIVGEDPRRVPWSKHSDLVREVRMAFDAGASS